MYHSPLDGMLVQNKVIAPPPAFACILLVLIHLGTGGKRRQSEAKILSNLKT